MPEPTESPAPSQPVIIRLRAEAFAKELASAWLVGMGDTEAVAFAIAKRDAETFEIAARIAEEHEYRCDCDIAYGDCDAHDRIARAIRARGEIK